MNQQSKRDLINSQLKISLQKKQKDNNQIIVQDALQTFIFQHQALEIKLQHNISQLSTKNVYLTSILKQLVSKEKQTVQQETQLVKSIIQACLSLEDQLVSLNALQMKTQILKAQVLALAFQANNQNITQKIAKYSEIPKHNQSNQNVQKNQQKN